MADHSSSTSALPPPPPPKAAGGAGKESFKASEHVGASEFVPSWLKKPSASSAAPQASTAAAPPPSARTSSAAAARKKEGPAASSTAPAAAPSTAGIPWKAPVAPAPGGKSGGAVPPSTASPFKGLSATAASFQPRVATAPSAAAASSSTTAAPPTAAGAWGKGAHQSITAQSPTGTTYAVARSDAEVLEIGRASTLKALLNAAIFVPGQQRRTGSSAGEVPPGTLTVSKMSPLLLPQSANNEEMLLGDCWCLYYLDAVAAADNDFDPTLVFRIDSVPSFWQTLNNIAEPTMLNPGSTLYLFRDDINPRWEDPKNSDGGMWRLKVPDDRVDNVWMHLCCRTVGESWVPLHRNTINGIVLKYRERGFWIEIWVTAKMEQFPTDILTAIERFYPSFNIDYMGHEEMQRKKQEALALVAASPKSAKNKKKRK